MERCTQADGVSQRIDGFHEVSLLFSFSYTCLELTLHEPFRNDSMIEDQSFPEPEENTFQIIHSKKRVTCIYQIEQDHTLVAVSQIPDVKPVLLVRADNPSCLFRSSPYPFLQLQLRPRSLRRLQNTPSHLLLLQLDRS